MLKKANNLLENLLMSINVAIKDEVVDRSIFNEKIKFLAKSQKH